MSVGYRRTLVSRSSESPSVTISIYSLSLQSPMAFTYFIIPMVRVVLGFGVLAFPFLLAFAISAFFSDDDGDEGTSNEDLWAKEGERRSSMRDPLWDDPFYSYILLLEYTSSESLPSALAARIWLFGVIDQRIENSNGLPTITFFAHEFSYDIEYYNLDSRHASGDPSHNISSATTLSAFGGAS